MTSASIDPASIEAWLHLNSANSTSGSWTSLCSQMNDTLNNIKVQREQSLLARKQLSDTTKQLKKYVKQCETQCNSTNNVEDALSKNVISLTKECKVTIKSYQEEIDNLTRRCKTIEQSYQSMGNVLLVNNNTNEAVFLADPVTMIQQLYNENRQYQNEIQQLQENANQAYNENQKYDFENKKLVNEIQQFKQQQKQPKSSSSTVTLSKEEHDELMKLRTDVAEYEVELRTLKNQDITVRKLEAKIEELQTAGAVAIQDAIDTATQELAMTERRRTNEALEREATAILKIQSLEVQLQTERAGQYASQTILLETNDVIKQLEHTWEAQKQILLDDNNRLREELLYASRTRDELLMQIAMLEDGGGGSNTSSRTPAAGGVGGNDYSLATSSSFHNTNYSNNNISSSNNNIIIGKDTMRSPPASGGYTKQDLLLERSAYEAEVAELSETNALLRDEIRLKEENIAQIRYELQARIDVLEREKGTLNTKMNLLETQLASAPSQALVDSMKRELRILKRLEYNAHDTDYSNVTKDPERTGDHYHDQDDSHNNIDGGDDLESVLIAKLRRVESELVTERTSKNELIQQISTLQKELNDVMVLKEDADKLIISLEKDLERAIHASSSTNPSTKNKSSSTNPLMILPSQNNNAEKTLQSILDPNATPQQQPSPPDPPMVVTAPQAVQSSSSSLDDNSNNNNEHSVATIVMAQRDRLRIRCETLEAERDSFKRELQSQSQTSESLKLDNTKLYEKVRYLQNFNNNKSNKSVSGMYNRSTTNSDIRDLDLEALEQRYEASVDPFKQFNKSERQRKLNEMSPMERTVYIVAKTVLATKEMRTGLFFYVVTLHLLVFFTTNHWSHSGDDCNHHYQTIEHLAHQPPVLLAHIQDQLDAASITKP